MKSKQLHQKLKSVVAFLLTLCIMLADASVAKAELTYEDLQPSNTWMNNGIYVPFDREIASEQMQTKAGKTYTYPFKLYKGIRRIKIYFDIELDQAADFEVKLLKKGELYKGPFNMTADSKDWDSTTYTAQKSYEWEILSPKEETDYAITITYKDSVNAQIYAAYSGYRYLLAGDENLTKGFTCKAPIGNNTVESYSIDNSVQGVTCISYDKKTNTVKGIRVGNSTLTLNLSNDSQIMISYEVSKNEYQRGSCEKPKKSSDGWSHKAVMKPYSAYYDASSNLVVKAAYINNTSKTVKKKNIKVTVKDENGKLIGSATGCKAGIEVASKKIGYATFTIKKSALKQKNADLAQAAITFSGCTSYQPVKYDQEMTLPTTGVKITVADRYNQEGFDGNNYQSIRENCLKLSAELNKDLKIAEEETAIYDTKRQINLLYSYSAAYSTDGEITLKDMEDGTYELRIYRHFDKAYNSSWMLTPAMAGYNQDAILLMLAQISSTPQKVYEGVYDVCYGEKIYQADKWYTFGDCKIKFKKDGYMSAAGISATFCIKEK